MASNSPLVNSVQQVSITIPTSSASATATINAVGANAFIIFNGQTSTDNGYAGKSDWGAIALTNSTTISASRVLQTSTSSLTLNATVIDPTSLLVDKVQFGTVSVPTSSQTGTATLSTAVDVTRSIVLPLGNNTQTIQSHFNAVGAVSLTNGTTVTGYVGTGINTGPVTLPFVVVEFVASAVKSLQQFAVLNTSSTTTVTNQPINPVVTNNSIIMPGGQSQPSSNPSNINSYVLFPGSGLTQNNVAIVKNGTNGAGSYTCFAVLEFNPSYINAQSGLISLATAVSATGTINTVDPTVSFVTNQGNSTDQTTFVSNTGFMTAALTNSNTVTAATGASGTNNVLGFGVAQFMPGGTATLLATAGGSTSTAQASSTDTGTTSAISGLSTLAGAAALPINGVSSNNSSSSTLSSSVQTVTSGNLNQTVVGSSFVANANVIVGGLLNSVQQTQTVNSNGNVLIAAIGNLQQSFMTATSQTKVNINAFANLVTNESISALIGAITNASGSVQSASSSVAGNVTVVCGGFVIGFSSSSIQATSNVLDAAYLSGLSSSSIFGTVILIDAVDINSLLDLLSDNSLIESFGVAYSLGVNTSPISINVDQSAIIVEADED